MVPHLGLPVRDHVVGSPKGNSFPWARGPDSGLPKPDLGVPGPELAGKFQNLELPERTLNLLAWWERRNATLQGLSQDGHLTWNTSVKLRRIDSTAPN